MELNKSFETEIADIVSAYGQPIQLEEGLPHHQRENIRRITFYSLSEYMGNRKDKLGRRKPFKNTVNEFVDSEVAATDPDFKQLQLIARRGYWVHSMLLRRKLLTWAQETKFSQAINKLNETYVRFGGVLAKRTIVDRQLFIEPVRWRNLIVDQIDIDAGAIIERHYLSPTQLRAKQGVWDNIEDAIKLSTKDRQHGKATTKRTEVLEVTGEFPLSYISEKDTETTENKYGLVHAFIATNGKKNVLLYAEEARETNYKYAKRKSELAQGRSQGMGVVEEGFETQIAVNEVAIAETNAFRLMSKVFGKTNAENPSAVSFENADTGTIFKLEDGEYLENMALSSSALPEFQRLTDEWRETYRRKVGNQDLVEDTKAGTAYSTIALQTKINSGRSDYRREEFMFLLKDIIIDWVIPFLIKEVEREGIIAADFSPVELEFIDRAIIGKELNPRVVKDAITSENPQDVLNSVPTRQSEIRMGLLQNKSRREIEVPKGFFKDVMKHITVLFDDEILDRKAYMQVLSEQYRMMPPDDPNRALVYATMAEVGGVMSPTSLQEVQGAAKIPTQTPTQSSKAQEINSLLPEAMQ